MGQKHTIITADQPLYSRGNELVWANPKFAHVIFIMGGLHICFNFQKAIGKHMENAGLDDPWTEAGVNAAHTTDAMLDGKAYYRAVRGHQLTYEALWNIKWPMFGLWLADNGHSHEVDVQADARNVAKVFQKSDGNCRADLCETFDKPSDILNTYNFQKLMKKFGEKCGCKSKCRTVRCSCFRKDINCSYACSFDAIECSNPAGQ